MTAAQTATPRIVLESIDSTNAEAARRATGGERGPLWIVARTQTQARARRGRRWSMGRGNLAATLLFRPRLPAQQAALHSFGASLAVAGLFDRLLPRADITLKWPNDVLIGGRKAAGILLESAGSAKGLEWLAIGIGINLATHPDIAEVRPGGSAPTSLLAEGADPISPDAALDILDTALMNYLALLERDGFEPIRRAWIARAAHRGRMIGAGLANEQLTGVFQDVDAEGNLVLGTPTGPRRIAAADIYLPETA